MLIFARTTRCDDDDDIISRALIVTFCTMNHNLLMRIMVRPCGRIMWLVAVGIKYA